MFRIRQDSTISDRKVQSPAFFAFEVFADGMNPRPLKQCSSSSISSIVTAGRLFLVVVASEDKSGEDGESMGGNISSFSNACVSGAAWPEEESESDSVSGLSSSMRERHCLEEV